MFTLEYRRRVLPINRRLLSHDYLSKAEVVSSILTGSTIFPPYIPILSKPLGGPLTTLWRVGSASEAAVSEGSAAKVGSSEPN